MALVFNPFTSNFDEIVAVTALSVGSSPNANALTIAQSGVAVSVRLQPASASFPGVVTTGVQSFAGSKTFSALLNADGGIDRSTSGTLTIGATNSSIINIGNSGATVNIQGTTIYENTPHLIVADPLITVNSGGGAGSGQNAGIEVEEASVITGYVETSSDRNSWIFKAPNTAGIVTMTPGASGFTIDQSSHTPLTLAAIGSTPNANAATLTGQVLNLEPASASFGGIITTGTQSFAGTKTFADIISTTFRNAAANPSSLGAIRLSNNQHVSWRNAANTGNLDLYLSTSDNFTFQSDLIVAGAVNATSIVQGTQLQSTIATGTAPLSVTSTTTVPNLHAALATNVTGTVAIANGGTGQITANAGFNALSPMTTGGDLIYGGASGVGTRLANGTAGQVLQSNGTTLAPTWVTNSTTTSTVWTSFTPTGTWTTNTTYSGLYRRVGDTMEIQYLVALSGAPNAATILTIDMPSGFTVDAAKLLVTTDNSVASVGTGFVRDAGTQNYSINALYIGSNTFRAQIYATGLTYTTLLSVTDVIPFTFGNTDSLLLMVRVPITGWTNNN